MSMTLPSAISKFGASAKAKLANVAAAGEPEDQLRAPLEQLFKDLAELCGLDRDYVVAVGESSLSELKTRPDYAVTVRNALVGFIEVKSPGKGADPRKFNRKGHDYEQWLRLQSLPNLIYTDGNEFSLWRNGELSGSVVRLEGDVETSGNHLTAPPGLLALFDGFLKWQPIPPRSAKELAETSARLCRLLRDEVTEQLMQQSLPLTALATDWRKMLFPDASDEQFADGYAQAVTFGLLMARAHNIRLASGLDQVGRQLGQTNSLIGAALRVLTDTVENEATLKTSLGTLIRVLDVVQWQELSHGDPDSWLYFYEDFLGVYDNALRKKTGSYYTPPEVVSAMVRLVDEVLRSSKRFNLSAGLASPSVTVADPAVGTGTFLLGILRTIAAAIEQDQGKGAVSEGISAVLKRLIAFEIQLGPFAVAQLRVLAELAELTGTAPKSRLRMFVTDTLSNPYVEQDWLPAILGPIADSRREANEIKTRERITVVIGNPPYKEKAKGLGGWIENGDAKKRPLLDDWMPPADWGVGAHAKHLRNLYVYFWRWATWKVFDHDPNANTGVVCFITVAGFLNGPGFQKMREYLRRTAEAIWVIDCSPEGHQPDVPTRIFQGVQQPVCIVLVSRSKAKSSEKPGTVRYATLPEGKRELKFEALAKLSLDGRGWLKCPTEWRASFLPAATGDWASYPALDQFFMYNGSGVMPGRTWVIAPDVESLQQRWRTLIKAKPEQKETLFHPHLRGGEPGDKHVGKIVSKGLPGFPDNPKPIANEKGDCPPPVRYGYRSFDRQWIIPDNRIINQPNPELWRVYSDRQTYVTAPSDRSPTAGPALTFTTLVPDLHHYNGRGGRVFPLWSNADATIANVPQHLLDILTKKYKVAVKAEDVIAYIACIAAHPAYASRFAKNLSQPGLRIPITGNRKLFAEAAELGRTVVWLHTFGQRFANPQANRPAGPPRLPRDRAPRITAAGAIPQDPAAFPDTLEYDASTRRLHVGAGYVDEVSQQVWDYEVSGKHVLRQWFSYRKLDRARPIMGDRRPPSKLGDIQPDHWLAEYTTELLNVINVLGRLVELEPSQAKLLDRICSGETIPVEELAAATASAPTSPKRSPRRKHSPGQHNFLD
jgi:hypothetical protein